MPENHLECRGLLFQFLFSVSSVRQKWSNTRSSRAWTRCAAPLSMGVYILVQSSFPIIFIIDKGVLLVKQSFYKYVSVKQSVCHLLLLRLKGLFPQVWCQAEEIVECSVCCGQCPISWPSWWSCEFQGHMHEPTVLSTSFSGCLA